MERYLVNKLPDLAQGLHALIDRQKILNEIYKTCPLIINGMPPTFENCEGGLYVGNIGVAYMFYYLAMAEPLTHLKEDLLIKARNYMDVSLSFALGKKSQEPGPSFLLGNGGVFVVSALVAHELGQKEVVHDMIKKYQALAASCLPINFFPNGSDELFIGRAGYICGALMLNRKFGEVISRDSLHKVCKSILKSGRDYAKKNYSSAPLMFAYYKTEYLGAAHGLSAIIQMLLHFPEYLKSDPSIEEEVQRTVDFMLCKMQPNGNIAPDISEAEGKSSRPAKHELVHWCHGAPGVVYMFAKAYKYYGNKKYLEACLKCGELTWQKGLLKKGPGICHGVAGSGYVFLLLYRLTNDEKHLHRAVQFADFIPSDEFKVYARKPDNALSLYEGLAGTMCFFVDVLQPQKAEFPFFNVFN